MVPNHYPQARADLHRRRQLADVGINVELQSVEFPTWIEQVYTNHDYDLTLVLHVEPRDLDNYANPRLLLATTTTRRCSSCSPTAKAASRS